MEVHPLSSSLQDRERTIMDCAQTILAEQSAPQIRIADIAKAAGISVGTFYTHFDSKEDLILGLVAQSTQRRRERFEAVFADPQLDCMGKIVVGMLRNFLFAHEFPGLFAAEELASTRAVWESATEARALAVREELQRLSLAFRAQAAHAIRNGHLERWDPPADRAAQLDHGAWFLMAGYILVYHGPMGRDSLHLSERSLPEPILHSLEAMLLGFGWNSKAPREEVRRFADHALAAPV